MAEGIRPCAPWQESASKAEQPDWNNSRRSPLSPSCRKRLANYTGKKSVTVLRQRHVLGRGDHQHEAAGFCPGWRMDGAGFGPVIVASIHEAACIVAGAFKHVELFHLGMPVGTIHEP